jgi:hypothetical protein
MRLPDTAQTSRPWKVHRLVEDFDLEDVWALPTPGDEHDFPRLVALVVGLDPSKDSSPPVRALFAVRSELGRLFGWDDPASGVGERVSSLEVRVPAELLAEPAPRFAVLPFRPLYMTGDEFAAEAANKTMHGVLHLGWVREDTGGYLGQMSVYVKPNGLIGSLYMTAIRPFRRLVVYPSLLRQLGTAWRARPPTFEEGPGRVVPSSKMGTSR